MKRALIIGAGNIAPQHCQSLAKVGGVMIVGICDLSLERAKALAQTMQVEAWNDPAQALEKSRPDYAVILTPRSTREELIDLCLAAKTPFFVEKPPCASLSSGQRISAKIQKAGIVHGVGFVFRWHEALNAVLQSIKDEQISVVSSYFAAPLAVRPILAKYPAPYRLESSGGLVGDQGIHCVDIARYICGCNALEIAAIGVNQKIPRSDVMTSCDAATWYLRMENGVLVQHVHTWCADTWLCRVDVITDRSALRIDLFGNQADGRLKGKPFHYTGKEDQFVLQHRGFLEAVERNSMMGIRSPYMDALESFRTAAEINRAIYGQTAELN